MVRKLRFHEQKLLKKVDFINWEVDNNLHEVKVLRKYRIEKREDYTKYNKLSRNIRELAQKIRDLNEKDGFRAQSTTQLLEKLYSVGLIPTKQSLALANNVNASSFCRRRLPWVMLKLRMAQNMKNAITFVEQGRILHTLDWSPALTMVLGRFNKLTALLASLLNRFLHSGTDIRVGPEIVTDPAFLVTRNMEDFVTWVDSSKIKQHVMNYNEEVGRRLY
ncbi:U3 small nucleolar ribonucleoprotein protein IMP3 [Tachysurus ichikawai]